MLSDGLLQMLRAAFTEEAQRLIENYRQTLADLSAATEAQQRRDCVQALGRLSHMLKGAGRSAECSEIESLSMAMEDKFKALRMESDDPHFAPASLQTICDAVDALELLTSESALEEDSDPPLTVAEIFGLIDRIESLELSEPLVVEGPSIDPTVRERLRLLTRILTKTIEEKCTGKNLAKAHHISQSLNKEVQGHDLEALAGVSTKLEALFQEYSQSGSNHQWPVLLLTCQALANYIRNPASDHEATIEQSLVELDNAKPSEDSSALHEVFLAETRSSLAALRDVLTQAKAGGIFDERALKSALSSLTGATQAVNLNISESICQSLNIVLETVVEFESLPYGLFEHAEAAISLLESDAVAFVEGGEEPDSNLVLDAIERLEAVTLEGDVIVLDPLPVKATPISPVKTTLAPPVESAEVPDEEEILVPDIIEEGLDQELWARVHRAHRASNSLSAIIGYLSYRDEAYEELAGGISEWRDAIAGHQDLLRNANRRKRELKSKELDDLLSFLGSQADYTQSLEEKLERWRAGASKAKSLTTEAVREVQKEFGSLYLKDSQHLLEGLNSVIQSVDPDFAVEVECPELLWDQRIWLDLGLKRSLFLVLKQLWEMARSASKTAKILLEVSLRSGDSLEFTLSQTEEVTAGELKVDQKNTPQILRARDILVEHGGRLQIMSEDDSSKLKVIVTVASSVPQPRAVFFEQGPRVFALPSTVVAGVKLLSDEEIGSDTISFRGTVFKTRRLGSQKNDLGVVFVEHLDERIALLVSRILGEEAVSPVGLPASFQQRDFLPYTACFSGDGRSALFLNPAGSLSLNAVTNQSRDDEDAESKPKVLVAEDFQAARLMFESVLGFAGYDVTAVESGKQALAKLSEAHSDFRAVISDIDMPEMDGFELCREIRKNENFSSLPFLLVSTLDTAESRQIGTDAGADYYLSKERFQSEKLLAKLSEVAPLRGTA